MWWFGESTLDPRSAAVRPRSGADLPHCGWWLSTGQGAVVHQVSTRSDWNGRAVRGWRGSGFGARRVARGQFLAGRWARRGLGRAPSLHRQGSDTHLMTIWPAPPRKRTVMHGGTRRRGRGQIWAPIRVDGRRSTLVEDGPRKPTELEARLPVRVCISVGHRRAGRASGSPVRSGHVGEGPRRKWQVTAARHSASHG